MGPLMVHGREPSAATWTEPSKAIPKEDSTDNPKETQTEDSTEMMTETMTGQLMARPMEDSTDKKALTMAQRKAIPTEPS
jgi:hypothetical protein